MAEASVQERAAGKSIRSTHVCIAPLEAWPRAMIAWAVGFDATSDERASSKLFSRESVMNPAKLIWGGSAPRSMTASRQMPNRFKPRARSGHDPAANWSATASDSELDPSSMDANAPPTFCRVIIGIPNSNTVASTR
jgi:hypothetical protein